MGKRKRLFGFGDGGGGGGDEEVFGYYNMV